MNQITFLDLVLPLVRPVADEVVGEPAEGVIRPGVEVGNPGVVGVVLGEYTGPVEDDADLLLGEDIIVGLVVVLPAGVRVTGCWVD